MPNLTLSVPGNVANAKVYNFKQQTGASGGTQSYAVAKVFNNDAAINQVLAQNGLAPSDGYEEVMTPGAGTITQNRYGGRTVDGWDAHLSMVSGAQDPKVSLLVRTTDGQQVHLDLSDVEQHDLLTNFPTANGEKPTLDNLEPGLQFLSDPFAAEPKGFGYD